MSSLKVDIAALGASILLAMLICYPKTRSLAYSMFEQWGTRKNTAKTQLEDLTVRKMYALQAQLNTALGDSAGGDELIFTVDPSTFRPSVLAAARYYNLRFNIDAAYIRGRRVAALVPRILEATAVSTIWFFVRLSWQRSWPSWTLLTAIILLAFTSAGLLASFLAYLFFEGRLQSTIVVAEDGER